MKEKYLIALDLDGTLLKDSKTSEIHERDCKAIRRAIKEGHKVCIITGRPWGASKEAYEKLELDTIIGNYNGAQIHNPSDYNFNPSITFMNLSDVMYIIGDKKIQEAKENLAIEGPGWVMVEKRDPDLERIFGFATANRYKVGIDIHKLPLRPTGIVIDTKKGVNILKLKDYLQRTYGDLVEFSSWSKGDGLTPVFDMTSVGVTKAKALSLMARFYGVPIKRTIAIGDGFNDVPMFETAEISVAMKNSNPKIKELVTYVTKRSNKEAGIAEFLEQFLDEKNGETFIKELEKKREGIFDMNDDTNSVH